MRIVPTKKTLPISDANYSRIKSFCKERGLKICVWAERILIEAIKNENLSKK